MCASNWQSEKRVESSPHHNSTRWISCDKTNLFLFKNFDDDEWTHRCHHRTYVRMARWNIWDKLIDFNCFMLCVAAVNYCLNYNWSWAIGSRQWNRVLHQQSTVTSISRAAETQSDPCWIRMRSRIRWVRSQIFTDVQRRVQINWIEESFFFFCKTSFRFWSFMSTRDDRSDSINLNFEYCPIYIVCEFNLAGFCPLFDWHPWKMHKFCHSNFKRVLARYSTF